MYTANHLLQPCVNALNNQAKRLLFRQIKGKSEWIHPCEEFSPACFVRKPLDFNCQLGCGEKALAKTRWRFTPANRPVFQCSKPINP